MRLQRYSNGLGNPLSLVENMRRQFDWVLRAAPAGGDSDHHAFATGVRFDSRRSDDGVVLTTELPGMKAEDISVKVEDRMLTISGRGNPRVPEGYETVRRERAELSFTRTLSLGKRFDPENIQAEMKDGILKLALGLRPEAKPKVIEVKAA